MGRYLTAIDERGDGGGGGEQKSVRKAGYLPSLMGGGGIPGRLALRVCMCVSWGKTWIH